MSAHTVGHSRHHNHGNPEDLDSYVAGMEDPARAEWQKPGEVIRALGLAKGQTVCDIGAGPGYFSLLFAKAVGDSGHVFAIDVEPAILGVLRQRVASSSHRNITPVLALPDDALLPDASCDLIAVIDTFHHFPDGVKYLRQLVRALKPGGRIVNIDFHNKQLPVGPPVDHLVAREEFLKHAKAAGLELVDEHKFLPYQYFLVARPVSAS